LIPVIPTQPTARSENTPLTQAPPVIANLSPNPTNIGTTGNNHASRAPSPTVNQPNNPTNVVPPDFAKALSPNVVEPEPQLHRGIKRLLGEVEELKTSNKRLAVRQEFLVDKINDNTATVHRLQGCLKYAEYMFRQAPDTDSVFHIAKSAISSADAEAKYVGDQLDNCQRIATPRPERGIDEELLCKKFENLYNIARDVFDGELPKLLPNRSQYVNQLLNSWGIDHPLYEEFLQKEMASSTKIGLAYVLRFLLAEAACRWVFDSSFPYFEEQESRILNDYREMIASQKSMIYVPEEIEYSTHLT
jgi:hypothetical protein